AARRRGIKRRTDQLRDRRLVNYSPLVKYVVGRVYARMTVGLEREELFSWGILGLLDAIETFDSRRGAKFETYAISKIRWAILDEIRKRDWVPRRVRTQAKEAERAVSELTQYLGRMPSDKEVARKLGMSLAEYRSFQSRSYRARITSLEAWLEADGNLGSGVKLMAGSEDVNDPQAEVDFGSVKEQLVAAIEALKEQERLVTTFYFYEGLTLKEIGKALNLSEGRISQILRSAIRKLRECLDSGLLSEGL
ncbi:MAG: FliA/WhiG family RNA polymerase sigma factor, partial [Rubrobacteraceae bacterium]